MPNYRVTSPESLPQEESRLSDASAPTEDSYAESAPEAQTNPTWTEEQRSYLRRRTDPGQPSPIDVDPTENQVTAMLIATTIAGAG